MIRIVVYGPRKFWLLTLSKIKYCTEHFSSAGITNAKAHILSEQKMGWSITEACDHLEEA